MIIKWLCTICIVVIILLVSLIGINIFFDDTRDNNEISNVNKIDHKNTIILNSIEIISQGEKTTPNTLMIYRTYYTRCRHYVQEYKNIDILFVNLTEEELSEKCKKWDIDKFSVEEIEMSREEEGFCGEHYKIKLKDNIIVIYNIDENGVETEYEHTGITNEYLTQEDILKLTSGIYIYGRENLTNILEDYE